MMQAIIDIGSNSVRLAIFSGGNIIFRDKVTAKLGQGFYETLVIEGDAIRRNLDAVKKLFDTAISRGVNKENVFIFATATVREAKNKADFCDQIYALTGLYVDILSESLEADCALWGALGGGEGAVLDLGGGSMELITAKFGSVTFSHSINLGAVKLNDMFGGDKSALIDYVTKRLEEYGKVNIDKLFAVGGSATCCAYILSGDKAYDMDKNHLRVVTRDKLYALADELYKKTPTERATQYNISLKRAETIHVGALTLALVLDYLCLDAFTVSEKDNLDGYYTLKVDRK